MRPVLLFLIVILLWAGSPAVGLGAQNLTPDLFQEARTLAFSGHRTEAMALCREILETDPGNRSAKILLGRVNAWEGNYAQARMLLG